jgi:DNA-3-methyladenine glycosylase II
MTRAQHSTASVTVPAHVLSQLTFSIVPVPPFRLDLTAWALRRRANNIVDRWDGVAYRRVLLFDDVPVEVVVRQNGPSQTPRLHVTLSGARLRPEYKQQAKVIVTKMLGLRVDLAPFYEMANRDSKLLKLVEKFRGVKPPRFPTIFETLANAFALQQFSLTVGIELLNRLIRACGLSVKQDDGTTQYAFPRPQDLLNLDQGVIRELGFSAAKVRAFLELSENVVSGRVNFSPLERMDNDAVVSSLLELRGVGRWTAEYVLLRGLAPLDVFPGDDVGARNRLAKWMNRKEPLDYAGVARLTKRWHPYAGMVYFHMLLEGLSESGKLEVALK